MIYDNLTRAERIVLDGIDATVQRTAREIRNATPLPRTEGTLRNVYSVLSALEDAGLVQRHTGRRYTLAVAR